MGRRLLDGHGIVPVLIMIFWVGGCVFIYLPPFWAIPTMFRRNCSCLRYRLYQHDWQPRRLARTLLVGSAKTQDTGFSTGLLRLAPWPIAGGVIILIVAYVRRAQNRGRSV